MTEFKDLPHDFAALFQVMELLKHPKCSISEQLQLEAMEALKYFSRLVPSLMQSMSMQRREMSKSNQRIVTLIDEYNQRVIDHLNELSEIQNSNLGQPTKNTKMEMLEDDRQRLLNYIACLAYSAQHQWHDVPDQAWRFLPDRLQKMVNEMIIEVGKRYQSENKTLQ